MSGIFVHIVILVACIVVHALSIRKSETDRHPWSNHHGWTAAQYLSLIGALYCVLFIIVTMSEPRS